MNYSHLIHERSLTTTPHRQKPIIEPPDYPVVFLTQKNKSDRVQLVFFVVEMRDLPYSDCYRRSIACSRRGSHGNAVLRFFQNRNKSPLRRYKKTSRTGFNLSSLWWRCGICLTAIATEGQSRAAEGVHTAMPCCDFFKIAINPRFDDIKKQVEQGSTCLLCGGDAGI